MFKNIVLYARKYRKVKRKSDLQQFIQNFKKNAVRQQSKDKRNS